jgi:hypothetical protein
LIAANDNRHLGFERLSADHGAVRREAPRLGTCTFTFSAEMFHAGYREEKMHQQGYKGGRRPELMIFEPEQQVAPSNRGEAIS